MRFDASHALVHITAAALSSLILASSSLVSGHLKLEPLQPNVHAFT